MLFPAVTAFVRSALPAAPARVLEVGAGSGELAAAMTGWGYETVAIDPAVQSPDVLGVALLDVEGARGSFDAAVAVLSLHHVEPLEESCRRLAQLVRTGGTLVVDEFDVERFDERAAGWQIAQRPAAEHHRVPAELVSAMRAHLHSLDRIREALREWFPVGEPVRGAYLYRWDLPAGLRDTEEALIAEDGLPATGARLVMRRNGRGAA